MRLFIISILVGLSTQLSHAKLYEKIGDLPTTKPFDFIVVGAGVAGSVIASRLSENPNFNVLLIEAGPNNEGVLELILPSKFNVPTNISQTYSWNYTVTPQSGGNNRTWWFDRGRVLGGSSSINAMIYTRCSADDYDSWAKITNDPGWSWKKLFPLIFRHEKWSGAVGGRDVTGQFNPRVHGTKGNSLVGLPWSGPTEFDKMCLKNTEIQKEFPSNLDLNSGYPIGLTWAQSMYANGERSSAATAYLGTDVRARPNLGILINTYATRVLPISVSHTGHLDVRRVEIAPVSGGETRILTARKEVILSGGAFGSPHILLNSGIGNAKELEEVGVKLIHNLPDVGKGLMDHPTTAIFAPSNSIIDPPPYDYHKAFKQWEEN